MMNNGARPLSLLYDTLVRPNADTGTLGRSKLCWIYDRSRAIPHLVVAQTPIGGSWNNYDDDVNIFFQVQLYVWEILPRKQFYFE